MSVKLIDNDAFYGYRVRRTVDGKLYQEYLSLKKSGKRMGPTQQKRVERMAKKRDAELEEAQRKAKESRKAERCFHADGSVKGISFLKKKEKSGNLTPIFQVGIASEIEKKIVCTSFSVNAHGLKGAWDKAIAAYTYHKSIRKNTKLYRQIAAAMPDVDLSDVEAAAKRVAAAKAKKKAAGAKTARKTTAKAMTKKTTRAAAVKSTRKASAKKSTAKKTTGKTVKAASAGRKTATAKKKASTARKKTTTKRK